MPLIFIIVNIYILTHPHIEKRKCSFTIFIRFNYTSSHNTHSCACLYIIHIPLYICILNDHISVHNVYKENAGTFYYSYLVPLYHDNDLPPSTYRTPPLSNLHYVLLFFPLYNNNINNNHRTHGLLGCGLLRLLAARRRRRPPPRQQLRRGRRSIQSRRRPRPRSN